MRGTIERARMLAHEAARAASCEAFAGIVVDHVWDLIPSDEVTFNDIDEEALRVAVIRSRTNLPAGDDMDEEFWADHYNDLPYCMGFGPGGSGVARMSDVLSRSSLDRSPIYRDMLWPGGLKYSVEVVFPSPPSVRWALLLGRADRDFSERECDLLALLLPHLEQGYRRARLMSLLTPRERDVLALVGQGLTNREIARRLDISPGTVRVHLEHAYPKLGVHSRTAAAGAVA
jgi:DNA-binding CsgD family transcriptional regulator